jgi:thiosulfate/3-mercaptopyruvate sulfurtransferase
MVVELIEQRLECLPDIREVLHPTECRVERTADMDLHAEGMPVQAMAFVRRRQVRQTMRRFDAEDFEYFHARRSVSADHASVTCSRYNPSMPREKTMAPSLPLLVEPAELESALDMPQLLLVDLNRAEIYAAAHVPGAVRLEYADITAAQPPAMGLLPDAAQLSRVMSAIGLTPDSHVVAYDADGNSRAARFLWTLEALGHAHYSLLNGGLNAWQHEGRRVSNKPVAATPSVYKATIRSDVIADMQWITARLGNDDVLLLDARTPDEYNGTAVKSAKGGHIPGAVNYDYANAIDQGNKSRLRPEAELRRALEQRGVGPGKEIVVYCQTHHRSAHTWFVLKYLGFPRVRGYPGSWSQWGNTPDTPVES